jgi:hypothetical protein
MTWGFARNTAANAVEVRAPGAALQREKFLFTAGSAASSCRCSRARRARAGCGWRIAIRRTRSTAWWRWWSPGRRRASAPLARCRRADRWRWRCPRRICAAGVRGGAQAPAGRAPGRRRPLRRRGAGHGGHLERAYFLTAGDARAVPAAAGDDGSDPAAHPRARARGPQAHGGGAGGGAAARLRGPARGGRAPADGGGARGGGRGPRFLPRAGPLRRALPHARPGPGARGGGEPRRRAVARRGARAPALGPGLGRSDASPPGRRESAGVDPGAVLVEE